MIRTPTDWSVLKFDRVEPELLETFSGTSIVAWQGKIERQLVNLINEYDEANNPGYVTKLQTYLKLWRDNPLTGSINVETLRTLLAPTEVLAVDSWKLQNYFSQLRDAIKVVQASVEELPMTPDGAEPPRAERANIPPPQDLPPSDEFGAEPENPGEEVQPAGQPQ